jgi:lipoprotein-releasing system ATP-binding protein
LPSSRHAIEARAVTRVYESAGERIDVLRGVDLAVAGGEAVTIMGPSGSGKSTLLHVLGTLDSPTTGEVRIAGRRVDLLPDAEIAALRARSIGFIFQFHHLLPDFTALENVMMPGLLLRCEEAEAAERARRLLEDVGVRHRARHRPGELSGGERQRVAVARALFNQPRVILADEPSGDLDRERAAALHDLLLALPRDHQIALVVATHDEDLARRGDRVFSLYDGTLHRI